MLAPSLVLKSKFRLCFALVLYLPVLSRQVSKSQGDVHILSLGIKVIPFRRAQT